MTLIKIRPIPLFAAALLAIHSSESVAVPAGNPEFAVRVEVAPPLELDSVGAEALDTREEILAIRSLVVGARDVLKNVPASSEDAARAARRFAEDPSLRNEVSLGRTLADLSHDNANRLGALLDLEDRVRAVTDRARAKIDNVETEIENGQKPAAADLQAANDACEVAKSARERLRVKLEQSGAIDTGKLSSEDRQYARRIQRELTNACRQARLLELGFRAQEARLEYLDVQRERLGGVDGRMSEFVAGIAGYRMTYVGIASVLTSLIPKRLEEANSAELGLVVQDLGVVVDELPELDQGLAELEGFLASLLDSDIPNSSPSIPENLSIGEDDRSLIDFILTAN